MKIKSLLKTAVVTMAIGMLAGCGRKAKYIVQWFNDDRKTVLHVSMPLEEGTVPEYPEELETPVKESGTEEIKYVFDGWSPEVGPLTKATNYYARYKTQYRVEWKNSDGSILKSGYTFDGELPDVPTDLKFTSPAQDDGTHYSFVKWVGEDDSMKVDQPIKKPSCFYASYNVESYRITWKNVDGEQLGSSFVAAGQIPIYTGEVPTLDSGKEDLEYVFDGWDKEIAPAEEPVTYVAKFKEVKKYVITWKNEDGTVLASGLVAEGQMPECPTHEPTKENTERYSYEFAGWDPAISTVKGDAVYTAKYEIVQERFLITWKNHNGTVLYQDYVAEGKLPEYKGEEPTKVTTEREAYRFSGWSPSIVVASEDAVYVAEFELDHLLYEITWKNDDGHVLATKYCVEGQTPVYPNAEPTKPSDNVAVYKFSGWNPTPVTVTRDATYLATFAVEKAKYPVTWKDEDGTVLATSYVPEAEMPVCPVDNPTKADDNRHSYTFAGWEPALTTVSGAVTYTAKYDVSEERFLVTWKDENGSVLATNFVAEGKTPVCPVGNPTKQDDDRHTYEFGGWSPAVSPVTADITYTAVYNVSEERFLITWKNEDGSVLATKFVAEGETPSCPVSNPIKKADERHTYAFNGWSPAVLPVTEDATYTAQFKVTEERFLVTWKNDDGSVLATEYVAEGKVPKYPGTVNPSKDDNPPYVYEFMGWDKKITPVIADEVYTATYKDVKKQYTIKWVDYDNKVLHTDYIDYGSPITYEYALPTRASTTLSDFEFIGWDKELKNLTATSDLTITALYKETVYKGANITYHFNETKNKVTNPKQNVSLIRVGTDLSLANATAPGYKFDGWFFDEAYTISAGTKLTNVDHDITLYGKFSKNTYTITYVMNGGELDAGASNPTSITCEDQAIVLANPSKLGYTFTGWSGYGSGKVIDCRLENVTKALTLTANFKANTYKIVLKYTDRDDTSINVDYNSEISGLPELADKEGSEFIGWFTKEGIQFENGYTYSYTTDVVLYPLFADTKVHKIDYELNGGVLPAGYPTSYKAFEAFPEIYNPTKEGYSFTGWTYVDPATGKTVDFKSLAGLDFDITLIANWGVREVTINYVYGEGATLKRNLTFVDETSTEIESHEISYFEGAEFVSYEDTDTAQFKGWADEKGKMYDFSSDAIVEGDTTLKPVMEPIAEGAVAGKVGEDAHVTATGSSTKVIQYTSVSAQDVNFEVSSTAGLKVIIADKNGKQIASSGVGSTSSISMNGVHFEANTTYLVSIEVSGSGDNNITVATTGTVAEGALSGKIYSKEYVTEFTVQHFGETFDNSIVPVKEGYLFDGWFDADGNYYDSYTELTSTVITLYAKWVKA